MRHDSRPDLQQMFIEAGKVPMDGSVEIPPKVFLEMAGEVIAYREAESLTIRFPVKEQYQNPLHMMQGGMIVAAIDNTVGPLSYLVAPASVTTQLNTSFIRPVTPDSQSITVEARVVELTRRQLFFAATVRNAAGKTVALAHVTAQIVDLG